MSRLLAIDLETSGLDEKNGHVILSIGAVIDGEDKELHTFLGVITPTKDEFEVADPKALVVNGFTYPYLLEHGKPLSQVADDFARFLVENKATDPDVLYIGQNPQFDVRFMRAYIGGVLDFIGFQYEFPTDVRAAFSSAMNMGLVPAIQKRSSEEISKALELEPEPMPHDALKGAQAAYKNYVEIISRMAAS